MIEAGKYNSKMVVRGSGSLALFRKFPWDYDLPGWIVKTKIGHAM